MTLAQMIARLTRGYIKETGRQPVGLDKLRIKMQAAEKLRQINKVVQFPQQRSFKQEIESMLNDGTIKMGGVTKQSDKVRTRNMFKDSNLNKPKPVKTEAELKAEMEASNKKSIQNLKDKMKDNPEDMADGGVAGLLGERPGYASGNTVLDKALALGSVPYNFAKGVIGNVSNPGAVTQVSLTQAQKNRLNEIAQAKGTPTGTIDYSDYGSPTKTFSGISNMTPLDASLATTMGGTGFSINPDGSVNYTGGAYDFNKGNVITDFIDKGGIIGAADKLGGKIYNTVNPPEEDDEYDFSGIEGQTAFLPELFMLGKSVIGPAIALGKSGLSKKAIAEALVKDRLRKEAGKKLNKKFKKIITPPKYPQGSTIKTKGPTTRPGGDRGRNIVSGRSGDRDFSSKGPDTSSNPRGRSNRASQERGYALHGADGGLANFADGGPARQNFAMGRRAFLKMLAGTGAGIAGLKSGIIGTGGKEVTKKAVTETVKSAGSTPPPYFFKLAEKIKKLGSDTTPTNDRTIAKSLKSKDGKSDYILEEDVSSGDTIIKKVNKEGDEMITDVQIMELRKGEVVKGKDGKARKTPDEYEEVTEANARIEGDVFNDPYYSDGIEIDDILREVDDIPVPKASGGIARMLGE
jgi:hypothetical protein